MAILKKILFVFVYIFAAIGVVCTVSLSSSFFYVLKHIPNEPSGETMRTSSTDDTTIDQVRDMSLINAALYHHKKTTGTYPKTLSDLVPNDLLSIPADPVGQKPYTYKLNEDGTYQLCAATPSGPDCTNSTR